MVHVDSSTEYYMVHLDLHIFTKLQGWQVLTISYLGLIFCILDLSMKDDEEGDIGVADFTRRSPAEARDRDHSAHVSVESNLDVSLSDIDLDATQDLEQEVVPLFVHFTCTLKRRTEHHNTSVTHIPQCLGKREREGWLVAGGNKQTECCSNNRILASGSSHDNQALLKVNMHCKTQ